MPKHPPTLPPPEMKTYILFSIVHPMQQNILKRHPPSCISHILLAIPHQRWKRIRLGTRHDLLPLLLRASVKTNRQRALQIQTRQDGHGVWYANGWDGDVPCGYFHVFGEVFVCFEDGRDVEEGLAHSHEHNVAYAPLE